MRHRDIPAADNHKIYTWAWADAAAKTAQSVTANDIGKFGWQLDTNDFYYLVSNVGPTWQSIRGLTGAAGKSLLNGTVDPTTEGVDGEFYINTTNNKIFGPKAAGVWPAGISLVGPQGPAGATGATGATGAQGPTGPAGSGNRDYIQTSDVITIAETDQILLFGMLTVLGYYEIQGKVIIL